MCGLFGFVTSPNFVRQAELYTLLAHFMSYRGDHSFGVSGHFPDGHTRVFRGLGDIVNAPEMRRKIARATSIQGHTRYATVGEISIANCHPFVAKHLLVAHNGGIWNHRSIGKADGRTYDVDSQALAWRIAVGGQLSDLFGYGAVSVVERRSGAQRVARLQGGELVTFRVHDMERDGHAFCYVSSLSSGVWQTATGKKKDLEETLALFGFHVDQKLTPAEGEVLSMDSDLGFIDTGDRFDLGWDKTPSLGYVRASRGGYLDRWMNGDFSDDDIPEEMGETRRRVHGYWRQGHEGWQWIEGSAGQAELDSAFCSIDETTGAINFSADDDETGMDE